MSNSFDEEYKSAVLILNPTSSPGYLFERFKNKGFFTIACFAEDKDIDYFVQHSVTQGFFHKILFLSGEFNADVELIQNELQKIGLNLALTLPSSEYDLPYSDKIANFFSPELTNSPDTSAWRCNKHLMNVRLRENKTPASKQQLVSQLADVTWDEIKYPIVVKPAVGGMGSLGVSICYSRSDIERYFEELSQKKWSFGFKPTEFLLEEYLNGEEYVVDMVAWKGKYFPIGIYFGAKEIYGDHKICRYRNFLPHETVLAKELFAYGSIVLKNLDVQYGMMHLECMNTKEGLRLIELNPRVSGSSGMLNYFSKLMTGTDQAETLINLFEGNSPSPIAGSSKQLAEGVLFYLQNFGFKYNRVEEELFKQLPSYQKHIVRIPVQLKPSYPISLLDTVAFVILTHSSKTQVEKDLATLMQWEAEGAFFK